MALSVPIGIDDFRKLREAGLDYVDKSDLIRQVLDLAGVPGARVRCRVRRQARVGALRGRGEEEDAKGGEAARKMKVSPRARLLCEHSAP
jgi:hypothetical protein